jgi:hypothetical protein
MNDKVNKRHEKALQLARGARIALGIDETTSRALYYMATALYEQGAQVVTLELPDADEEHEKYALLGMPPDGGCYRFEWYPPHD